MTATTHPLGRGMIGQVRLGDELASGLRPHSAALLATYTITGSQYGRALSATYTIQATQAAVLLAYYTIAAPSFFAINGDATIIAPDQVTYIPRSVSAHTLLAQPLLQGYENMVWTYTQLQQAEAAALLAHYDPTNPQVVLTYPNADGLWVQRTVSMLPPNYGVQETVSVSGLTLTFLLLPN